jgi:hypothetical protein
MTGRMTGRAGSGAASFLIHNSISFIGKGRNGPQEIAPHILTHFNFQYFYSALGTLRDISTTMREKEKSRKHALGVQ